ncbi:MAG TPA: acetate--CoA ligase family protein [Candidatus Paceibacterota bacterium]
MELEKFFRPESVALIGARPEDGHVGSAIMKNLLAGGKRAIYPVTREYREVLGVPAYSSLDAISEVPDLALIAIKPELVPDALRACARKGVKAAVVVSAGFKEAGPEGKLLEEELHAIGIETGLPFLGPNCLGVIDGVSDLNASFTSHRPLPGTIGFVSQSGAIGTAFIEWSRSEGVGISKFVSLGNEAGVSEVTMLEYLGNDPDTRSILVYLEHVSDGPRFLAVAKEITQVKKKPIVLLRSGRSERGSAAAMSHTGSLAPEDAIFTAVCRQAGIATVTNLRDLFSAAKLLSLGTDWGDKTQLAIVTNGGGPSVNAADLVDLSESMDLARFNEQTTEALRGVLPPMAAVGNPIDVIGDAGADRYKAVLDILIRKADINAIVVIVTPQMMTDAKAIAEVIVGARASKLIIPVFMGGEVERPGVEVLQKNGMVNFDLPSDAIIALDVLTPKKKAPKPRKARTVSIAAMLSFDATLALLKKYDLGIFGSFVRTKEEVASAFEELGSEKVAMKVVSQDVIHKTDVGAVMLNIQSTEDAARAWDEISANVREKAPQATIEGMLLQPMIDGREVIVGMKRDPVFGPVIVFGLGGIFVELLDDVSMRTAPFSEDDAYDMIGEIAGTRYLEGFRGSEPINKESLAQLLVAIGQLAVDNPDITEIDLNPVIATDIRSDIVDARFMEGK